MTKQLGLDLPAQNAWGRDDFMVAPSNALALAMIDSWPTWEKGKLVLSGPKGAGKTHLTHIWADATGARIINARDLDPDTVDTLATGPVAVEDVPDIRDAPQQQTALFHLHNLLHGLRHPLLMTGAAAPSHWAMTLPDLQSRIDAAGNATLDPPDDSLLAVVLAKLFNDRQLTPRPDVIPYLVSRMERSFDAARRIVSALDAASLAQKKPVTRPLAVLVLDNDLSGEG